MYTRDFRVYSPSPIALGTYLMLPLKDLTEDVEKYQPLGITLTKLPSAGFERHFPRSTVVYLLYRKRKRICEFINIRFDGYLFATPVIYTARVSRQSDVMIYY